MKNPFYRATLLGLVIATSGCNKPVADFSALEARLGDMEESVREDKQVAARLRDELQKVQKRTEDSLAEVQATTLATTEVGNSLAELKASFAKYRDDYRAWIQKHGPGMKLGNITVNGRTLQNVVVKSVNGYEVAFSHDGGVARLALADASRELREKFAYIPGTLKPVAALPAGALATAPAAAGRSSGTGTGTASQHAPAVAPADTEASAAGTSAGGGPGGSGMKPRKLITLEGGQVVELIADFGSGAGMGGTSGSTVKGYSKDQLPPGYKPIGAGFSGSSLGKDKAAAEEKKKHPH